MPMVGAASTWLPGPGPLVTVAPQTLVGTHTGPLVGRMEFQGEIVTEEIANLADTTFPYAAVI